MKLKLFLILNVSLFLTGCELLDSLQIGGVEEQVHEKKIATNLASICIWDASTEEVAEDCDLSAWLRFWADIEKEHWPARKQQIESLGEQNPDILKKILLSQGKGTPYQDRLRAQTWAKSLLPKLSQDMRRFLMVAMYQPSQELLELESALVTLSNINTKQSTTIEEQMLMIKQQQNQIEQLLKIEASILENTEGEKP